MSRISIAPSKSHIWNECHGQPLMASLHKGDIERDRTPADEGTTGHALAEMLVLDRSLNPAEVIGTVYEKTGMPFDDDMWDGAVVYVDYIASVAQEGATWAVEAKLPVPEVHGKSTVIIDAYSYDSLTRHLDIYDYKYGFKLVEAYRNTQLTHGASAVHTLCKKEKIETPITVTFHVVQPRGFHHAGQCRSWSTSFDKLQPLIEELRTSAHKVFEATSTCTTGPWCSGCPALYNCSTYRKATTSALDFIGAPMPINASAKTEATELSLLERAEKLIKDRKTALQERIKHRFNRGEDVPGYEIRNALGNRTWNDDADLVIQIGESMGLDLLKKKTACTPAQAVRLGMPEDVMESLVRRESLGNKLVRINKNELESLLKGIPNE